MDPHRSRRIAILAALVVIAAIGLAALGRSGRSGSGGSAAATDPARSSGGTATTASTAPNASRTTPPTSGSTPTTVAATDPTYPVTSVQLPLYAHNNAGATVSVPTTVWLPSAGGRAPFPLVVFSTGYQIDPSVYNPLVQAWAAAGYVVAEPIYPDTALGSPAIEYDMINHPGELSQVISTLLADSSGGSGPLAGQIDPARIAVAGQSDGGDVSLAAVANTCCVDHRIKAAVILSGAEAALFGGAYYTGTGNPPLLAIQGDADTINPPPCSAQLYDGAAAPRYYLDLPGASHLSAYTGSGAQFNAVTEVSTAFLDGYLKGITNRISTLPSLAQESGVSSLVQGSAQVPITGGCPGAPGAS